MRQHGATHHVAHSPNARQIGFAFSVDHDRAAFVQLQAHSFCVQANGVWHSANGHDEFVCINAQGFTLGIGVGHFDAFFAILNLADFDAEFNFQTLFVKSFFGFLGNLLVDEAQESGQAFEDGDIGAQTAPDRSHFQSDDTGAN